MLAGQDRSRFGVDWCADYASALVAIREQRHDVYLVDYRLGEHTGLELVREGFASRPVAPVIILTGQGDYEIDLEATALGVTDYLVKQELDPLSLERSIRYAISHHRAIRDLARSEERYALAVRAASDGIWDWDLAVGPDLLLAALARDPRAARASTAATPRQQWFDLVHRDDDRRLAGRDRRPPRRPHAASRVRASHAPRGRELALGARSGPRDPR